MLMKMTRTEMALITNILTALWTLQRLRALCPHASCKQPTSEQSFTRTASLPGLEVMLVNMTEPEKRRRWWYVLPCRHCTEDEFSALTPYPQTLHLQLAPFIADDGEDDTDEDDTDEDRTDEDGADGGAGSYCPMDNEEMSSSLRTCFFNQFCGNINMIYTISLSVTVVDYNGKKGHWFGRERWWWWWLWLLLEQWNDYTSPQLRHRVYSHPLWQNDVASLLWMMMMMINDADDNSHNDYNDGDDDDNVDDYSEGSVKTVCFPSAKFPHGITHSLAWQIPYNFIAPCHGYCTKNVSCCQVQPLTHSRRS